MPKNPTIADVFAQIGRAEELGSGMCNLNKFSRLYTGRVATLADGDVFRARVPVTWSAAGSNQDSTVGLATSIIERDGSLTITELAKAGDVSARTAQRWIRRLTEEGRLVVSARDPTATYCPTRTRHDVANMSRHCRIARLIRPDERKLSRTRTSWTRWPTPYRA